MTFADYLHQSSWVWNLGYSCVYLVVVLLLRMIANSWIERRAESSERRLRWKIKVRNTTFIVLSVGLLIIWGTELKTLALSLVAVAVAIILATKELIMCLTGSLIKATSGSFSTGDRIIIGDHRGEVIDQTLLSTTLMEIGPGERMHQQTGRAITLPNSIFVSAPVVNESYRQHYVLHGFSIPISLSPKWKEAEKILLRIASEVCEPFGEDAERYLVTAARKRGVDVPNIKPRVSVVVQKPDEALFIVRVPAPVKQRGRIEQKIIRRFLTQYLSEETGTKKSADAA